MQLERATLLRLCGLFGTLVFLALYLVAMSLDSVYVFGENYLSDLGVREGAWAFNSGLIIAGILYVLFSLFGLGPELGKDVLGRLGTAMMVLSALLLVSIGIFTEDAGDIHGVVSYAFFLETLATVAVVDLALYKTRILGLFGPVVSTACLIFGLGLLPFGGTPLVETLAVFVIIIWGVLISVRLALKGQPAAVAT